MPSHITILFLSVTTLLQKICARITLQRAHFFTFCLWNTPRCCRKAKSRMNVCFPVKALILSVLCRSSLAVYSISLEASVWMTNKPMDKMHLKRTKAPRKPWRPFPLLQRSNPQESERNLWTPKRKCSLRRSNQARLPLNLSLPLTLLDFVLQARGLFVHQPLEDISEAYGPEKTPLP